MGYPPPCQPPLVAAESSSPFLTPKSSLRIVDFLFPRYLLPGGRVSVHLPPKWLVYRVVSIPTSRGKFPSLPVAGFFQSTEVSWFLQLSRPFSTPRCRSGFGHGGPSPLARKRVARFPSGEPVTRLQPKLLLGSVSRDLDTEVSWSVAVCCSRGCPEELLLLLLPAVA